MKSLVNLNKGDCACVTGLTCGGSMRRRLQDLGIVEGTQVECTHKSPYGDPVAYAIRGAIIALRCEDASKILIS